MQTFTGRQYLQIDIANSFGLDKKTWAERLAWYDQHAGHLHEMVQQAEHPALFYAGVRAMEAVEQGEPIGFAISLDATSSGLQILAALTGDRRAALLCNVVNQEGDIRANAYTLVYEAMLEMLGEDGMIPDQEEPKDTTGVQFIPVRTEADRIDADDVKKAIMTSLYGSKAQPKRVFGEGRQLIAFKETMKQMAPGAWELNEAFLKFWDPKKLSNDWVLPDNFHVHVKVMGMEVETVHWLDMPYEVARKVNMTQKEGRSLGANTIHSIDGMIVREMCRRCDYDPAWIELLKEILDGDAVSHFEGDAQKKEAHRMVGILWKHYEESGYLSARILDYIDSDTIELVNKEEIRALIASMPAKPFKIMSVHDCFRCLPHYGNDLRRQYNLQLHLIAKSNLLSFLLTQITGRKIEIDKLDDGLFKDILESDYSLS